MCMKLYVRDTSWSLWYTGGWIAVRDKAPPSTLAAYRKGVGVSRGTVASERCLEFRQVGRTLHLGCH